MKHSIEKILYIIMIFVLIIGCTPGRSLTRSNAKGANSADASETIEENEFEDSDMDQASGNKENKDYESDKNQTADEDDSDIRRGKYFQVGVASWYGREFHGRATASGERFDMKKLTAAHKTLPFGTLVEIKDLTTGKTVQAKINDRGPFRASRIIDLSYAAAKKLGILGSGKAQVGIKILKKGEQNQRSKKTVEDEDLAPVSDDKIDSDGIEMREEGKQSIQMGAFYSKKHAEDLKKRVEDLTYAEAVIVHENDLYKVRMQGITKRQADRYRRTLSREEIPAISVPAGD
jgi:rare lipoprotein A